MPISLRDIEEAERQRSETVSASAEGRRSETVSASAESRRVRLSPKDIAREQGARGPITTVPGEGIRAPASLLGKYDISRPFLGRRDAEGNVEFAPEGTLPTIGQAVGSLAPGPARYIAGPLGAGAGAIVEGVVKRGEVPPASKVLKEVGISALGDAAEGVLRGSFRQFLRGTKGGQQIRFDEAARQARELPGTLFEPQEASITKAMFEQVGKSGVKLDTGAIENHLAIMSDGKLDDLVREVRLIDQRNKTGRRFAEGIETLLENPEQLRGVGIEQLQQLSSELRKRIAQVSDSYEGRQLLVDFRDTIDDTIFNGEARGLERQSAGGIQALLKEARGRYARQKASEELGDLVEQHVRSTPDLEMASFNLRSFVDELRRGRTKLAQDVSRALDYTPGAAARFDTEIEAIAKQFKTIELSMADTAGFRRLPIVAGLGQAVSTALLTEKGREIFTNAIVRGRGQISPNLVSAAANAARRELYGTGRIPGEPRTPQEAERRP